MPTSPQDNSVLSILSLLLNSELLRWFLCQLAELWHRSRFQGTYRVEAHESTLALVDDGGSTAVYTKRQQVEFLQDGIFCYSGSSLGRWESVCGVPLFSGRGR